MRVKSFRRRRETFLRSPEERERKQIPWSKYFYLGVLASIIIAILTWGGKKLIYIQGVGVLEAETTQVEARLTARIEDITCAINDKVSRGTGLIFLVASELKHAIAENDRALEERRSVFRQKKLGIKDELKILEQEKKNREEETEDLNEEYKRAQDLLALESITRSQFLEIEYNLKLAERELSLVSTKAVLTGTKLEEINNEHREYLKKVEKEMKHLYDRLKENVLLAPRDGIVTMLYKQVGEVVQAGEPVVKIADLSENFIKTFFDGSVENELVLGAEVSIVFDNGDESRGRIKKIYSATRALSSAYRTRFGIQERFIIAEIIPIEGKSWAGRILQTKARVFLKKSWL